MPAFNRSGNFYKVRSTGCRQRLVGPDLFNDINHCHTLHLRQIRRFPNLPVIRLAQALRLMPSGFARQT
jgi:hypothetical protein